MALDIFYKMVELNNKINSGNDQLLDEFQAIVARMESRRTTMMRSAEKIKRMKRGHIG
ncbi:hypothetical protein SAMN02745127_02392 [Oceanospirillum multiglobuliferum]|uniref:hypothetical protein n=1 Tax=Oceanospirillum multiglobuliferum TaxID=64969 RepID=UPI0009CF36BC|nr:hypothetical protein [Oceanospirillum multiglobuliferum]SKA15716.1 hypothetical protein SAMN02745127_02392 [Oceanospirillum multiglobuliferum]